VLFAAKVIMFEFTVVASEREILVNNFLSLMSARCWLGSFCNLW